jgi:hypothetical protein
LPSIGSKEKRWDEAKAAVTGQRERSSPLRLIALVQARGIPLSNLRCQSWGTSRHRTPDADGSAWDSGKFSTAHDEPRAAGLCAKRQACRRHLGTIIGDGGSLLFPCWARSPVHGRPHTHMVAKRDTWRLVSPASSAYFLQLRLSELSSTWYVGWTLCQTIQGRPA